MATRVLNRKLLREMRQLIGQIATIALGVFFSTAISVYSGVDAVPRNLIRMAQSFNVPFHAIVRRVIWPGALPSILAGFRITTSVALLLVVGKRSCARWVRR